MWGIDIGKTQTRCCSAVLYRDLNNGHSISRNNESFWITENFLNIGARVFIGTAEYNILNTMLHGTATDAEITKWIDKLILRHASIEQIHASIGNQKQQAYYTGRQDAKEEIRAALRSD